MLNLNCFFDLTGLKALNADPDALRRSVYDGAHEFKVRKEATDVYTGDLKAHAAFFSR